MKESVAGFRFSPTERDKVRQRANGTCEFPGEICPRPPTPIVNHITGVFEARLDNKTKESISDPDLNALMLCALHSILHDIQEKYQVENLLWERTHTPRKKR